VARLHLVRHGQAAAGWGDDADPGLSPVGSRQAEATAERLAASRAPCALRSSPSRRARETAGALAARWGRVAELDPAFGEVPSPSADLAERAAWLPGLLAGRWSESDDAVAAWRAELVAAARAITADTVAFTHFVAINALVSAAQGTDEVTAFLPANASVTTIEVADGSLEVVDLGEEAPPEVG